MRLPQNVGEYRFIERLGGGAFGTVYRAEIRGELGYRQECAVKLLDPGRAASQPEEVAALADEARILSRLDHPTIVHVRRFVQLSHEFLGDTWGLEMELVRGATLDHLIARQTDLTVPAVVLILTELLDGLQYAHAATDAEGRPLGLVHRDIKPENIVISYEGRIKLLDFGIARVHGRIGQETSVGETKGTPLYMSPEQLRGESLGPPSDLYALGTLAFELLTPQRYVHLEDAPDVQVVLVAVSETRFEDRRWLLEKSLGERPGLSEKQRRKLIRWVGRLLVEEPGLRTQTAADALDELASIPGLTRPHRARDVLRDLVHEVFPPDEPRSTASKVISGPVRSVGPTQLVPSVGVRPEGGDSDWLVGRQPLEEALDVSGRGWIPVGVAAILGLGLLIGALFLVRSDRPTIDELPSGEPVAVDVPVMDVLVPTEAPTEEAPSEDGAGAEEDAAPVAASLEAATPAPAIAEPAPAIAEPAPTPAVVEPEETILKSSPGLWTGTSEPVVLADSGDQLGRIEHSAPTVVVAGSPLRFKLRVVGGEACTPRLHWGPRGGAMYRLTPFVAAGDGWAVAVQVPYDVAHAAGVSYHLDCCTASGSCIGWKSAAEPERIAPPDF
jgi:serine/threonine protein kinase